MEYKYLPEPLKRFVTYKTAIQNRSVRTVDAYIFDLLAFFNRIIVVRDALPADTHLSDMELYKRVDMELVSSVKKIDIMEYIYYAAGERDNKPTTRARKLASIRSFYKYLYKDENSIAENPAQDIETPPAKRALPKYLDSEESVELLETVAENGDENAVRNFAIITLFLNCGLRVSELCGMSLKNFSRDLRQVTVTGKGAKQRTLYLNDACREALSDYLEVRAQIKDIKKGNDDALFISRNKRRISIKTVQWIVYRYIDQAGLSGRGMSAHKLRHTAATLMYQSGRVDIRTIKDILGHEQLNTTQIYTHVSTRQLKEAAEANPLSEITRKKNK